MDGYDVSVPAVGYNLSVDSADQQALLELHWKYKEVDAYYAGFDTVHEYGSEGRDVYEIERNHANAWARFGWRKDFAVS